MYTALITGGAGFIGSHLVELLLENKYKIIVVDNLSTGKIENIPINSDVTFIEGDITSIELLETINRDYKIDYIFHLAAIASVALSMENPIQTHNTNFDGTLNILNTFKNSSIKKLVYASSAAVYGNTKTIPTPEDSSKNPMSPYGVDKLSGEYYLKVYNDNFNIPSVSCRFFNVFGERQDPSSPYSGVISIFFNRCLQKKQGEISSSINIYGDGTQTRDFIYVKDVVRALFFLATNDTVVGESVNIGYGKITSIKELANVIKHIVCDDVDIHYLEGRSGDIQESLANVSKLKDFGFSCKYSLIEGLQNLNNYLNI